MSAENATYRRVTRRETHSPRAGLAITLAVVLAVFCALVATEIILGMLHQRQLLASIPDAARWLVALPRYPLALVTTVGILVALGGLVLIAFSLTAGRRGRHLIETDNTAAVVDNEVIASALARHAAHAGNVNPDNVRVTVSHRNAVVRLTPASGLPVDREAIARAVEEQLVSYRLRPTLRSRIEISSSGKVGS